MSKRSDRAAERKAAKRAKKQAEQDLDTARAATRKAFDLKDPRFLGEAAVAATRGPVGLALFGASRGLQVARDKRAERTDILDSLTTDAKQHADSVRERASDMVSPPAKRRSALRRFAPLWIVGLAGGATVAGATAYFLRDQGSPTPASSAPANSPSSSSTSSSPSSASTSASASGPTSAPTGGITESGPGSGAAPQPAGSETGEDLTIDSPDPEGPANQSVGTTPAAESAKPGPAAGTAPQPSDDASTNGSNSTGNSAGGNTTDK